MATQNVNIGINVSDNGTAKKVVQSFKEITNEATKAQTAAEKILAPAKSTLAPKAGLQPGGTSGSRMAAERSAPTGSEKMMGEQQYNQLRGSAGITGASARDFANQAQGLGGLVRLYATYAANLFAVGAAFSALKNAADTTNLVKGLDTLGAASGQALGSLSKRLVEVTDGAISMREAMTATAQASSAGMTGKNIERLAIVAKNASLALGVSMPDALSRMSRGIVKLEPELLDELGLFTKIGPATEKYALELGKTASSLTDFERRQAFANAVLEEGEKKFGALADAAANPYDKLLSSLKNILQSGGELINKVLTPIISLLANSPTALTGVLTGIGVILLKQALPAIGQLRAGLRNSAEDALKASVAFKQSFGDEFQTILEKRFKIPDLEAGVKKAETDLAKMKFPGKMPGSVSKLVEGELNQININKALATRNNLIETGMRGSKKASEAQIDAAKQEILYIQKAIDLYSKKQAVSEARTGTETEANKEIGRFDPEVIALQKYEKLRSKVDRANAISNAAQVAQVAGVRAAWGLLNQEVADKGITGFTKFTTLAQGGLAAVGTRVMGILGSLGQVGQVIGLAVAGFMLLDSWFTSNAKQAEKFSSALTTAEEAMANVARTISAATTTEGFSTRTIVNTVAFSNALNGVTSSLADVIKLSRETDKAANSWDNFWDIVFSVVGKDRASKLAKNVANQIQSSIDLLSREGLAEQYKAQIQKILQVDDVENVEQVTVAFKNLNKEQQNAIVSIQETSNRTLGNAGAALQSFKDKTDEALKAQKALSNTFLDTSPTTKYGESLVAVSNSLSQLLSKGPERVAQALEEISTNMEKAAMFGPDFVNGFGKISSEFGKQKAVIDGLSSALVTYQKELKSANTAAGTRGAVFTETAGAPSASRGTSTQDIVEGMGPRQQASIANSDVREIQKALAAAPRDAVDKSIKLVETASKNLFEKGMAFIGKAVREAQTTAAITIGKVLTSNLTGPQKLQAEAAFTQQEIKARLADIQISEQMLDTQSALVSEMKLANALQAEANTLQKNAGKTDAAALKQNADAAKKVFEARYGLGVDTSELSPKEKADIDLEKARQKQTQQAALRPAKILAEGQLTASQLGLKGALPGAELAQAEELKKIGDKTTASLAARQEILSSIASTTTAEIIKSKQDLDLKSKEGLQAREIEAIQEKINEAASKKADAEKLGGQAGKTAVEAQEKQLEFLGKLKTETEKAQKADKSVDIAKNRKELLAEELTSIDKRYELLKSTNDLENQIATSKLESQSQLLSLQGSANQYSQEYMLTAQADLDREKALVDTTIAREQAESSLAQKREAAEARIAVLKLDNSEKSKLLIAAETAELTRQETLTNNTIAGLINQYTNKVSILAKTKEINLEQDKYNQMLDSSTKLASALGSAFGELGNKLGSVVSSLTEIVVSSEKSAKAMEDLKFDRDAENDPKKRALIEKEIGEQTTKNTKSELMGYGKIAGAAKSLFKEKTAAYKVLAATEKAMQVATLVMEAKTFAMKMGWITAEVGATVGADAAIVASKTATAPLKVAADAPGILSSFASMGPVGYAIGAALVAALFAMVGGGGSKAPFVPTAEQRQETQGTAMGYDEQGNKVQIRRGVFGDTEAKSESIAKSLEVIRDNSVKGLSYDNKMLRALENLNNALDETAKGLYKITGLRTGSLSGVVEGTNTSGGLLGIGGLFSKSVTKDIIDSGIQLKGTFYDLIQGIQGTINTFETVSTTVKRSGLFGIGGGTSTSVSTEYKDLLGVDEKAFRAISNAFGYASDLLYSIADTADIADTVVADAMRRVPVDEMVSLRGLSGEEFTKELSSVIGAVLDDAALAIFTSFDQYAQFGEGMLETVVRVIDTNTKVNQAVSNIGFNVDLTKLYDVTEALAKGAGGLEKFIDQSNYFAENFMTEAERLVPVQKAVNAEMLRLSKLGYTSADGLVDTRKEFKQLVLSLDLTSESGQEAYRSLMNVQEGFVEVTKTLEDSITKTIDKFTSFVDNLKTFRDGLLLGSQSILSPLEKYTQAKMQYETTFASALAGDEKAQEKYQSVAQTFLTASGDYFASSGQYIKDFNKVIEDTKLGITESETQIAIAKDQRDLLSSIDTNIAILAGVPQKAAGGRASGLTLVGERGPELVDFSYPGMVYTADQTRGMFAPQANMSSSMSQVVQELRQVKQELAQLRKEQQQQTGDLIVSNYDANNRAAEAVTTEVANAATLKEWQQRNKAAVI